MGDQHSTASRIGRARTFTRVVRLGVCAAIALACDTSGSLKPRFDAATSEFRLRSRWRPDLLQIVRLTPLNPARGDSLRIEARLVNLGRSAITVETRICGLSTKGTLSLGEPFFICAGYSGRGLIAPGDTVRGFDRFVVESAPGTYSLAVMHLVDPELWVPLTVTVRSR